MHLRAIIVLFSFIQYTFGVYNNPYRIKAPTCSCQSTPCCQDDNTVNPGDASPCHTMIRDDNYEVCHTGAKILNLSKNSHFENLTFHKIHIFKISCFTKFTFSKSHFSQNSHFQILIFHKIHIFKASFFKNG